MGKERTPESPNDVNAILKNTLDSRGIEVLRMLLGGSSNRDIAIKLKIPMSTTQKRTRELFQCGVVRQRVELDYRKMGLRKGLIHVYVRDGDVYRLADKVAEIRGVSSVSVHIGNSDVVGSFVFKDAIQLLNVINKIKGIDGVDEVLWSEEVYSLPEIKEHIILESD